MKWKFWKPQVMDYYLAISYQLPGLAHYRYCYLMMLFDAYIMLLWLVQYLWYTKCMMTIIGLVHTKRIKHMQLIIRFMHFITIGVSTWNCICYKYTWNKLVVTPWNYQMLVALLLFRCNWNDMVINTLEINQIHIIFYWVSEYKPHYYQYWIITSYAHLRYI